MYCPSGQFCYVHLHLHFELEDKDEDKRNIIDRTNGTQLETSEYAHKVINSCSAAGECEGARLG